MGFWGSVTNAVGAVINGASSVGSGIVEIASEASTAVTSPATELVGGFTTGILLSSAMITGKLARTIDHSGLDDIFPPVEWLENILYFSEDTAKNETFQAITASAVTAIIIWHATPLVVGEITASSEAVVATETIQTGSELQFTGETVSLFEGLGASESSLFATGDATFSLGIESSFYTSEGVTLSELSNTSYASLMSAEELSQLYQGAQSIIDAYTALSSKPEFSVLDYSKENDFSMPSRSYSTENILYEDDEELYYIIKDFRGFITKLVELAPTSSASGRYNAKSLVRSIKDGSLKLDDIKSIGG